MLTRRSGDAASHATRGRDFLVRTLDSDDFSDGEGRGRMRRSGTTAAIAGALGLLACTAAAQGPLVATHGACATARGGASVAAPCDDGSAILYNPAAIALQRNTVSLGWTGVTSGGSFTHDHSLRVIERERVTGSHPTGFASIALSGPITAGLGLFTPIDMRVDWPVEPFEGRHVAYSARVSALYLQPTAAYRLSDRLALGGGIDLVRGSLELRRRLELAPLASGYLHPVTGGPVSYGELGVPAGIDFADERLAVRGSGTGFHLAALARPAGALSIGIRYLHSVRIAYSGDASYEAVETGLTLPASNPLSLPPGTQVDALVGVRFRDGSLADQPLRTELTLPPQVVVGAAWRARGDLRLLGDVQWTGWRRWDGAALDFAGGDDRVLVLDYRDATTYRLGAEYQPARSVTVRGGLIHGSSPQREFSVSPLFPEGARSAYALGLGYRVSDALALDLGYQRIRERPRRGRVRGREPGMSAASLREINSGVFASDAYALSATASFRTGGDR